MLGYDKFVFCCILYIVSSFFVLAEREPMSSLEVIIYTFIIYFVLVHLERCCDVVMVSTIVTIKTQ